jgi:hypothetical protein
MGRKRCTHSPKTWVSVYVTWCPTCSHWSVRAALHGRELDSGVRVLSEELFSDFLEIEASGPDENARLMSRLLRAAQEHECDALNI